KRRRLTPSFDNYLFRKRLSIPLDNAIKAPPNANFSINKKSAADKDDPARHLRGDIGRNTGSEYS
ncbi:hypothetical protein, partial [Marinomonas transparens]